MANEQENKQDAKDAVITTPDPEIVSATKKPDEHMVPISRLNQEIEKRKAMEERLAVLEKANKESEVKRLKETEDYRALYEKTEKELSEVKPKAAIAEESEKTLRSVLESQIAELPENMRSLIPAELTTQQQLSWLSKNKPLLVKPKAVDIGAGKQGGAASATLDLTPEELDFAKNFGITPEDYAKNKFK